MKKTFILLFLACFVASSALAYGSPYEEIWFDFESTTWPNSFYAVESAGIQICVPDPLAPMELNEANIAHGIVAMFMTEAGECMYVSLQGYVDANGAPLASLPLYQQYLLDTNPYIAASEIYLLNGVPALIYTDTDLDEKCVSLLHASLPGTVVTVTFSHAASHPEFMEMTAETIPSIMPLAE